MILGKKPADCDTRLPFNPKNLASKIYCNILLQEGRAEMLNCLLCMLALLHYFSINIDRLEDRLLDPE